MRYLGTGLWADVQQLPGALQDTIDAADGVAEAAGVLRGARRIVATGNGAAYYVAHALWLASLDGEAPPVVALPCGVVAREGFRWREGDAVLAVSSSGEFRDVVEIARGSGARPCVAITASAGLGAGRGFRRGRAPARRLAAGRHAHAGARGRVRRGLSVWASLTGDRGLAALAASSPAVAARAVTDVEPWAADALGAVGAPAAAIAVGGGAAWAAALELALMLKEISRIPAEGVETREGATSAMFGLDRGHLMVSLDPEGDQLGDEAERLCAAAGATTLRLPAAARADARLAPITTLPAAAALSAELALAAGHDVDKPAWTDAYYETARSAT